MNIDIKDLTIYCVYHENSIIDEYNLNNLPQYIKLLNIGNLDISGDNINYLNPYLCELCAYYYIWKNNIYSPYVGFCHYRRFYWDIGLENLKKYGCHFNTFSINIKDKQNTCYVPYLMDLYNYLKTIDKYKNIDIEKYFNSDENLYCAWKMSSILKWEYFIEICEIIFGFLKYINGDNYLDKEKYINIGRSMAWQFEIYYAIIIGLYFNNLNLYYDRTNIHKKVIVTYSNNILDINKWIKKNYKTQVRELIISDKFTNKDFENGFINGGFHERCEIISSKEEIKKQWYVSNDTEIIELNINEYIDCLDPIYFINNEYDIKKI